MYNPETVLEDETHKLLWNFEIQTDHIILARRLNLVIVKTEKIENLPVDHSLKIKESEKRQLYQDFPKELERNIEHECNGEILCGWSTWNNPQRIGKGIVGLGGKIDS